MAVQFSLTESQQTKLDKWTACIKEIYGEHGLYEYRFSSNGIGLSVSVYSTLADAEIDLTEVENW